MDRGMQRNSFYWLLFIGAAIIEVYFLSITLQYPMIGMNAVQTEDNRFFVAEVNEGHWGDMHNVEVGSEILRINGRPADEHLPLTKLSKIEKVSQMTLLTPDGESHFYTPYRAQVTYQIIYHILLPLSFFLCCFGLSLYMYRRKHHLRATEILVLFLLVMAIAYQAAPASSRGDFLSRIVNGTALMMTPLLYLQFCRVYFRSFPMKWLSSGMLSMLYGAIIAATGMEIASYYYTFLSEYTARIQLAIFLIFTVLIGIFLLKNYLQMKHTAFHTILKTLLMGYCLGFAPFLLLFLVPLLLLGEPIVPAELTVAFLLFLPASFFYLMVSERLIDVDYVFHRLKYYSLIAILPAVLGNSIFLFFESDLDLRSKSLLFVIFYGTITLFLFLKDFLDYRLQLKSFSEKYNYQSSLYRFSQKVKQVKKVKDLTLLLQYEFEDVLHVRETAVFVMDRESFISCEEKPHLKPMLAASGKLWKNVAHSPGDVLPCVDGYALVIGMKKNMYTLLWISPKTDRTGFTPDEKDWMRTLCYYTSILLENLYLIENLIGQLDQMIDTDRIHPSWLSKMLFTISERERSRLAKDLHDTILQEQLFLYRKLDTLRNELYKESKSQLDDSVIKKEMNTLKEHVLDSVHLIRETCNELRPPFLAEIGIGQALEHLIQRVQLSANFRIEYHLDDRPTDLDDEAAITIFRMIQELLNNAMKHSNATVVQLDVDISPSQTILIRYNDDGIGMEVNSMKNYYKHMGIYSIQERVHSLGGETTFTSTPGEGLQVEIVLPYLSHRIRHEQDVVDI
ncbi:sensor histidine kinase [Aureibacillus halotolerans]|uniref:histidine kinase n=1 Tax=Aureibacillus halotolerans TaxID=1508390 RepID=A0A4R6TZ79_9BACI|nr:sensor histidine kinase [Aureibacillus halotolerans]TDQ36104.1 two-component system sensor histidine kinase ComP [Aureibacillus halotolerans]